MATASSAAVVLFFSALALLSASAAARPGRPFHPCGTLFVTYTVSTTSSSVADADADADDAIVAPRRAFRFVSIYRIITPFSAASSSSSAYGLDSRRPLLIRRSDLRRREVGALGFGSLQAGAKDILVVVVGLLFGVGCGAITAATMCLAWSIATNHYEVSASDEQEEYSDEGPEEAGYIKIPAPESASGKDGYEGK